VRRIILKGSVTKEFVLVWIRFIWIRSRSLKSFFEHCDEVTAVVVQHIGKRT
jgi:hypothetical protein